MLSPPREERRKLTIYMPVIEITRNILSLSPVCMRPKQLPRLDWLRLRLMVALWRRRREVIFGRLPGHIRNWRNPIYYLGFGEIWVNEADITGVP